ncbi:nuclear transport factor 2 family protein [Pedobacter mucosus]|uniref:nuclear transport factor 2 family protein n=1 Tax=Pedobacter mucosus TaxID=2895286 RepID=UPI001EE4E961|nr:nuclear transport factor 2 family protein [Pedobacter mucosus]UKT66136.1 nuclear transport factor 2 family protein [Pedobacter mucosus]
MATTKELIEKVNQIFKENKMEEFIQILSDDIVWDMHSSSTRHSTLRGKDEISNMDPGENMPARMDFEFGTIIIEGNSACVECTCTGEAPNGKPYHGTSCDIYHFSNDKISRITSYVIDNVKPV